MMNLRATAMLGGALIALPFSAIWMATQAPQTYERWYPRFSIARVETFAARADGFEMRNVVLRFNRPCEVKRAIYVESTISAYLVHRQFLLPTLDAEDKPIVFDMAFQRDQTFAIPYMHVLTARSVTAELRELRFEVGCVDEATGVITPAFSNTVAIPGR